jgi:hypothetical protein
MGTDHYGNYVLIYGKQINLKEVGCKSMNKTGADLHRVQ